MDGPMVWLLAQLATADCEAAGSGLLEQDANGWSSLGYGVAGVYLLLAVSRGRLSPMALRPKGLIAVRSGAQPGPPDPRLSAHPLRPAALVMALALIAEAVGSVLFHGAPGSGSRALHDAALLAILGYVAGWHVGRAVTSHTATADRVALAGTALGAAAGIVLHLVGLDATTTIAAALVATVAGAELMARRRGMAAVWTPALLVLAGVAALLWMLGRDDSPVCDPDSLAQAHAAWHVASALVLVAWTDRTSRTPALRRYGEQQGPTALRSRPLRAQDGDTESRGGSTMAESTPSTRSKTLDVVVTFEESDDHTDAHASLVLEGEKFAGFGRARRAPGDPDVPTVGDELALARAMHELSTRLLEAAEKGVADFEGRQVDLHL